VQLDFLFDTGPKKHVSDDVVQVGDRFLPIRLVRNHRARRYILRLTRQSEVRVTIPRGGSQRDALKLAHDNVAWLEQQCLKQQQPVAPNRRWGHGTEILFRGEMVVINVVEKDSIRLIRVGEDELVIEATDDIRVAIERHLWLTAQIELPPRVEELARLHAYRFQRVTIRNQRTRWGSCSPRGTISLNWRLIQMPAEVSDYIILHELAHTRFMDHSRNFWREVKRVFPGYREAENWVKRHGEKLLPAV
jgi:predicted metal-dependent hydrolase